MVITIAPAKVLAKAAVTTIVTIVRKIVRKIVTILRVTIPPRKVVKRPERQERQESPQRTPRTKRLTRRNSRMTRRRKVAAAIAIVTAGTRLILLPHHPVVRLETLPEGQLEILLGSPLEVLLPRLLQKLLHPQRPFHQRQPLRPLLSFQLLPSHPPTIRLRMMLD